MVLPFFELACFFFSSTCVSARVYVWESSICFGLIQSVGRSGVEKGTVCVRVCTFLPFSPTTTTTSSSPPLFFLGLQKPQPNTTTTTQQQHNNNTTQHNPNHNLLRDVHILGGGLKKTHRTLPHDTLGNNPHAAILVDSCYKTNQIVKIRPFLRVSLSFPLSLILILCLCVCFLFVKLYKTKRQRKKNSLQSKTMHI